MNRLAFSQAMDHSVKDYPTLSNNVLLPAKPVFTPFVVDKSSVIFLHSTHLVQLLLRVFRNFCPVDVQITKRNTCLQGNESASNNHSGSLVQKSNLSKAARLWRSVRLV